MNHARPVSVSQLPARAPAQDMTLAVRARAALAIVNAVWLPRIAWSLGRTGRAGLAGIALILGSGVFMISTLQQLSAEVRQQRADLREALAREANGARSVTQDPLQGLRRLPTRAQVPDVLGRLLNLAQDAQLSIDTAKYEISATKTGSLVRYQLAFPVDGSYPQIRRFIDSALKTLPELAVNQVSIARKSIGDGTVEAQLRMTIFTRGTP